MNQDGGNQQSPNNSLEVAFQNDPNFQTPVRPQNSNQPQSSNIIPASITQNRTQNNIDDNRIYHLVTQYVQQNIGSSQHEQMLQRHESALIAMQAWSDERTRLSNIDNLEIVRLFQMVNELTTRVTKLEQEKQQLQEANNNLLSNIQQIQNQSINTSIIHQNNEQAQIVTELVRKVDTCLQNQQNEIPSQKQKIKLTYEQLTQRREKLKILYKDIEPDIVNRFKQTYQFHNTKGDGNCFYRAAQKAMHYKEDDNKNLKDFVAKWIIQNRPYYQQQLQGVDINQLLLNVQQDFKFAGEEKLELHLIVQVCIIIHIQHPKNSETRPLIYNSQFRANGIIELLFTYKNDENGKPQYKQGHYFALTRQENSRDVQKQKGQYQKQENKNQNKTQYFSNYKFQQKKQFNIEEQQQSKPQYKQENYSNRKEMNNNYNQNNIKHNPKQQSEEKSQQNQRSYSEPRVQQQYQQKDQIQNATIKQNNNQQRYPCEQCNILIF